MKKLIVAAEASWLTGAAAMEEKNSGSETRREEDAGSLILA